MRLIDADELKKDDEVTMWLSNDAIRTGKQLKMFSEYFINKIDKMPTIQAIPISVIEDIKAEIQGIYVGYRHGYEVMADVLAIIDKHIGGDNNEID